ncbi:hypothetical protein KIN20_035121 [Parelaphostrongylus tenuis]|uniref:Uncharacterized protein n=1 Tax=Parelaphostrongylus tenuis TaxID=148309 RepID=A0AAD5RAN3_PARTN|nr:hypothetical protein KIN20_035121 [Parelaphostrongylus tenuis]
MREDSVTDAHLAQLNTAKTRRVMIDGFSFWPNCPSTLLQLGDESLRMFAKKKNFPVLILDSRSATIPMICRCGEDWLASAAESKTIRPHICTMRRCAAVNGPEFRIECENEDYTNNFERAAMQFTFATETFDEQEDSIDGNTHENQTKYFDLY